MEKVIKTDRAEERAEPTEFFNFDESSVLQGVYLGQTETGHKFAVNEKFTHIPVELSETINEALKEVKANFEAVKIECLVELKEDGSKAFEISRV